MGLAGEGQICMKASLIPSDAGSSDEAVTKDAAVGFAAVVPVV